MYHDKVEEVSRDGFETNDHQILRSILNDGHYDISAEDWKALESVIAILEVSNKPVCSPYCYLCM